MLKELEPIVGMACTVCIGSDKYAAVITKVSQTKKIIHVREEGENEDVIFTRRNDGNYRRKSCYNLILGIAQNYFDTGF